MNKQPEAIRLAEQALTRGALHLRAEEVEALACDYLALRAQVERLQAAGQVVAPELIARVDGWRCSGDSEWARGVNSGIDAAVGILLATKTAPAQEAADTGADEPWAVFDSQGYYAWHPTEGAAKGWCAHYNARSESDPLKPYTYRSLSECAALAASTGANVDAGMVPLTAMRKAFVTSESFGPDRRYELVFKFESLVDLQAAHREWVGGIQASGGAE